MEAEARPQAKGRVQIPRELTRAEGARQIHLPLLPILNSPPNHSPPEVLENPSEEAVLALLLLVHAPWPLAHVQAIVPELTRQELASLFTA